MTQTKEEIMEEICDMILKARNKPEDAQNIGIDVLNKFGWDGECEVHYLDRALVIKFQELALYVQSLERRTR